MFVTVSVEKKYKVGKGKGRGKRAILNRMIKEGVMDKCKQRPEEKEKKGEERELDTKEERAFMSRS